MIEEERAGEIEELLRSLDNDPPRATADEIIARARRSRAAPLRVAAGIAAVLAVSGIAWAVPGSPVPAWVRAVLEPVVGSGETGPLPEIGQGGGILFDPAEPLLVRIAAGSTGHVRIIVTARGDLVARMAGGEARFSADPGQLGVELSDPDVLELLVPESAASIVVIADGQPVFTRQGGNTSSITAPDSMGTYLLPLQGAR